MRLRSSLAGMAVALGAVMLPAVDASAAVCDEGTLLAQDFPSTGAAVARWELCWAIRRMPDESGSELASETLVITQAEFRPGANAELVRIVGVLLATRREGVARFSEGWTRYPIWVTRNDLATPELRARDLLDYANREDLRDTDVALWYVAHHDHESDMRDEDRDTVPVKWVGFTLEPQNLWDATPFYP